MELWVRTQTRFELAKINSVYAGYQEKDKDYVIMGEKHNGGARLGSYATKERALEVLDEIQAVLECVHTTDDVKKEVVIGANMFYEMPEK